MIAVLGGTFDPVHNAHLAVARRALDALAPQRLLWMPTGAPGYRQAPVASGADRVAMLRLAIGEDARQAIDARELAPGHSGYTVDTMTALRAEFGSAPIVLVMGADQYAKLDTWHRPDELRRLCSFAVVARPGYPAPAGVRTIEMAPMAVSASDIRARVARGEDASALLPAPVLNYIRQKGLYR